MLKNFASRVFSRISRFNKNYHSISLPKTYPSNHVCLKKCHGAASTVRLSTEWSAHKDLAETGPMSNLSEAEIRTIAEGDPEIEKLLKIIILEVDIFRQDGQLVPDKIEHHEWRELVLLKGRNSRLRYLTFLFKNEQRNLNKLRKIEERRQERIENAKIVEESGHIKYGFGGNTIYLRIYDSTMDFYMNKGLINAALYSQHVVIDCSYDQHMTRMEARNCAKQLCYLFSENRNHPQPFHLQFCNVDPESTTMEALHRYIPPMYDADYPLFASPKSYLDLYPKEKLVYLTPHCKNDLVEWNHDDVYIIGAMVDKSNPKPLSLAKAKEEGLRMAKLPLERHLIWGSGATKNLTLNQMTSILLDRRHTGDWLKAFKHIPKRKIVNPEDLVRAELISRRPRGPIYRRDLNQKDVQLSGEMIKKMRPKMFDVSKLYE